MVARVDPSVKVAKAAEFLGMAEVALARNCFDSAVSLAVSAGINASDALCLHVLGRYSRVEGHEDAVVLVGRTGVIGRNVATSLRRLLSVKNKAQYSNSRCSVREAEEAFKRSARILNAVRRILDAT